MIATLLIDLDDTLLENDINSFLPAYLKLLGTALAEHVEPNKMIATLMAATAAMQANTQPNCTLQEVFDSHFYPALGLSAEAIQPIIDRFYAETFPTLKPLTRRRESAVRLVEAALGEGHRLAIATNPLFPLTAILQRLEWAGLPEERYPFALVPSYETFHFAKPNPAFFTELLARLGWPEGPVVVVGNDPANDIAAASAIGLPTFWVTEAQEAETVGGLAPTFKGSLDELLPWLKAASPESLQPRFDSPAALLTGLAATPALFDSQTRPLAPSAWKVRPAENEWSLTEIVCHLRDVDGEVNLPRLKKVLDEHNPFIPGMDTDPWAAERQYIHQDGPQALQKFIARRSELLGLLKGLPPAGWSRPARHAIFGRTELRELVSITAAHDRLHVQQALALINTLQ